LLISTFLRTFAHRNENYRYYRWKKQIRETSVLFSQEAAADACGHVAENCIPSSLWISSVRGARSCKPPMTVL